jgi:hypothetical protein
MAAAPACNDRLDLGRALTGARKPTWLNSSRSPRRTEVHEAAESSGPVSPVNNDRIASRRPTLTVNNSDRNAAIGNVSYEFQIATDQAFTKIVASGVSGENPGQTSFTPNADLAADLQHFWRVRAGDGDTTSAWAATQTFRTANAPTPGPGPSPNPGPRPGGSCASNNGPAIASCIAAKYPEYLAAGISLGQRQANMSFLRDRIIEAGKCGGLDLGHHLKRGGTDISIDFLAWRQAAIWSGSRGRLRQHVGTAAPGWSEAGRRHLQALPGGELFGNLIKLVNWSW